MIHHFQHTGAWQNYTVYIQYSRTFLTLTTMYNGHHTKLYECITVKTLHVCPDMYYGMLTICPITYKIWSTGYNSYGTQYACQLSKKIEKYYSVSTLGSLPDISHREVICGKMFKCNSLQLWWPKTVFLFYCPDCESCPAHLNSIGWATWTS